MYNLKQLKDARCMSYKDGSISIGGDGKILYSTNAVTGMGGKFDTLSIKGKSDVMSIEQVNTVGRSFVIFPGNHLTFDMRLWTKERSICRAPLGRYLPS